MVITGLITDIKEEDIKLTGPWKYRDSNLVTVFFDIDGKQSSVLLSNLLKRGFSFSQIKYYSFLQFKVESRKKGMSVDEIRNDEKAFMDCLKQVNLHFLRHSHLVSNQEIEEFRGPQSFEDHHDNARFYYYGLGKFRYFRQKDLADLLHNDFGQVKANKFMNDPTHAEFTRHQ